MENPYLDSTLEQRKTFKAVSIPFGGITHFFVIKGAFENREIGTEYTWNLGAQNATPVIAMDSGKVVKIINPLPQLGGCNKKFKGKESIIWVEHLDKSIAIYKHVRPRVVEKQIVTRGQRLGSINISGVVCKPQLEISIVKDINIMNSKSVNRTIPLVFKGIRSGLMKSRRSY